MKGSVPKGKACTKITCKKQGRAGKPIHKAESDGHAGMDILNTVVSVRKDDIGDFPSELLGRHGKDRKAHRRHI